MDRKPKLLGKRAKSRFPKVFDAINDWAGKRLRSDFVNLWRPNPSRGVKASFETYRTVGVYIVKSTKTHWLIYEVME